MHRHLTREQQKTLVDQGCRCDAWDRVTVAAGFDTSRVHRVTFCGDVRIGNFGRDRPHGCLLDARIERCMIDDDVRIVGVRGRLSGYVVGAAATLEDIGSMETRPGARFGNGTRIDAVNESGGRSVTMFDALSAQWAALVCLHRHRPRFVERLEAMADAYAASAQSDVGSIGAGARLEGVDRILDVQVGAGVEVIGASRLEDGTILGDANVPTHVGQDVDAQHFIVAEGARVDRGALVTHSYVGQGAWVDRRFSMDHALFFANSEALHGEAVSIMAGPWTSTHHKSTLLIAGCFSYFNAGSGTNQSNHLYRLGPVHEGRIERGCKTGSGTTLTWPTRVGPFSVVVGRHTDHFDTSDLPFSLVAAAPDGHCRVLPGRMLQAMSIVRDPAKWRARDRCRDLERRRDRTHDAVLSPYTVGAMMRGLEYLAAADPQAAGGAVQHRGVQIPCERLAQGQRFYRDAIEMYLLGAVTERWRRHPDREDAPSAVLAAAPAAVGSARWLDLGGQIIPVARLEMLESDVLAGRVDTVAAFEVTMDEMAARYDEDCWAWVRSAYEKIFGRRLDDHTAEHVETDATRGAALKRQHLRGVLAHGEKDFAGACRIGYGEGDPDDAAADFEAVRGRFEEDRFVIEAQRDLESLDRDVEP